MPEAIESHLARVLLLVDAFSASEDAGIDGLTKLAKLDFLVRYPVFLEQLNLRQGVGDLWPFPRDIEREAVDSPMIRYKYGPWDDRYYVVVGGLVGRRLLEYVPGRGKVAVRTTAEGRAAARELSAIDEWVEISERVRFLKAHYDLPGSQLKQMIYESFPRLVDQSLGTVIGASPRSPTS